MLSDTSSPIRGAGATAPLLLVLVQLLLSQPTQDMLSADQEQGEILWSHIGTILRTAGMGYENIVSSRTYLSSPEYGEQNVQLRMRYLGSNEPALTVVCCQLLESKWKLETAENYPIDSLNSSG